MSGSITNGDDHDRTRAELYAFILVDALVRMFAARNNADERSEPTVQAITAMIVEELRHPFYIDAAIRHAQAMGALPVARLLQSDLDLLDFDLVSSDGDLLEHEPHEGDGDGEHEHEHEQGD